MARITVRSKILIPLAAMMTALGMGSAARAAPECLAYGAVGTVDGWLSLTPATPAQIAAGMAKGASTWSIKLAQPVCMAADGSAAAVPSVSRIALKLPAEQDKSFRSLFGKRVQVTGVLRAADPAKLGAPVLLEGVQKEKK